MRERWIRGQMEIYRGGQTWYLNPHMFWNIIFSGTQKLILSKIIKIVANSCQILRLKCTKFHFGCGSAPDPTGGAYSATQDSLAGFKGAPRNMALWILTPQPKIVPAL